MQISNSVILGFFAAAFSAIAGVQGTVIEHVERQLPGPGSITRPTVGTHIPVNTYYDFSYTGPTYCRPPGTLFDVYLTREEPLYADLTTDGQLTHYIEHYGSYSYPNYRAFPSMCN